MVRVAVQDANILIDLELAALFDLWLQAGIETHTTDLIRAQLRQGGHALALTYIESGAIQSHRLSSDDLSEVLALMREVRAGPDLNDCSVLWLVEKLGAMVLTGDAALRQVARERQIEVHGTLWIFDRLIECELLGGTLAASKLEYLLVQGRRLPREECAGPIRRWRREAPQ